MYRTTSRSSYILLRTHTRTYDSGFEKDTWKGGSELTRPARSTAQFSRRRAVFKVQLENFTEQSSVERVRPSLSAADTTTPRRTFHLAPTRLFVPSKEASKSTVARTHSARRSQRERGEEKKADPSACELIHIHTFQRNRVHPPPPTTYTSHSFHFHLNYCGSLSLSPIIHFTSDRVA